MNNYEINFSKRTVLFQNPTGYHSKKIELAFENINDNNVINSLDKKDAYYLGSIIGACNSQNINNISRIENFKIYNLLCVIYVFLMIMSNIFSTKLISINGFTVTGAFLMYPITYVLNFIISEIYGYKNARRCIHYVMITFLCFILSIKILLILPASEHWKHQSSLESLFGLQTRVFIASLIAFATSTFISSYILQKLKKRTKGAYLFIRIIFSLLILEMLDTCLFCFLAFYNIWDIDKMMKFFVLSYLIKLLYEVTIYPFITAPLITKIKKIEKLDILDTSTNFNPLLMDTNYDDSNNLYKKLYLRSI